MVAGGGWFCARLAGRVGIRDLNLKSNRGKQPEGEIQRRLRFDAPFQ